MAPATATPLELPEPRRSATARHRQHVLVPVGVLVAMAALILPVIGLLVRGVGIVPASLGTLFALLPVPLAVAMLLWVDRWEPEPRRLLLAAFLWGAGVATLASVLASAALDTLWSDRFGTTTGDLLGGAVEAPVVEEALKGAFLLLLLWKRRGHLDGVIDGIVYAGLVAVGFAFTENVVYLGHAFGAAGLSGGVHLFVLRCVFSPFAHPLFTAMTGLGVASAARRRGSAGAVLAPIAGYLAAVTLHGSWNASSLLDGGTGFATVYLLVMVPLFCALVVVVLLARHREQVMLARQLPGIVAGGWISPVELGAFATLTARRGWRRTAHRRAGRAAARAVRRYQGAVSELAFLRDRMARGTAGPDAAHWHRQVVRGLNAARARALADTRACPPLDP